MRPYPDNKIDIKAITPVYVSNEVLSKTSRYSTYRVVDNQPFRALEIRLTRAISKQPSFRGYYYTTTENETLFSIAKKYYDREDLYWIIAKVNNLKDSGLTIVKKGDTVVVPNYAELQNEGGYFTNKLNPTQR